MKSALKITLIYAAVASLWIILSDKLIVGLASDVNGLTFLASVKGMLFVTVTGAMLFLLVLGDSKRIGKVVDDLNREAAVKEGLIKELHHRIRNNIQVIIGILDLDTRDGNFTEEARQRIVDKLISMESTFNIVYTCEDMRNISIKKVLDEYARINRRELRIKHLYESNTVTVETLVTLLLVVDSVLSGIERGGYKGKMDIEVKSNEVLDIYIDRTDATVHSILGQDEYFALFYLQSIGGSIHVLDGVRTDIRIIFKDRPQA
jgi:hypothetical protein